MWGLCNDILIFCAIVYVTTKTIGEEAWTPVRNARIHTSSRPGRLGATSAGYVGAVAINSRAPRHVGACRSRNPVTTANIGLRGHLLTPRAVRRDGANHPPLGPPTHDRVPAVARGEGQWFCRNAFHVGEGGFRGRTRYFSTVHLATSMPHLRRSPTIRGEPHIGFARHMSRISSRTSLAMAGRPGVPR
jgi:hypothetical protein